MDHPHHISAARRLRIASLLLLGNRLLILTAVAMLLVSLFAKDQHLMIFGAVLVAISLALIMAQWVTAPHAGCPWCRTPGLAPLGYFKHRKARRLLGSYHMRVAFAIMFTERFRCPFCHEHTAMDTRETLLDSRSPGTDVIRFSRFH